jgi:hypothetical protein
MNYILLNNLIFNHADLSDKVELRDSQGLTEKVLNPDHSCYCNDDYDDLINEIHNFLSDKTGATLVVSTFFYKLPCFTELLSEKLNNIKIVPLILFFIENNNDIIENEEFAVNEVYNRFVIKTACKVANEILTIVSQELEQFDFDNGLLEEIEWIGPNLSIEEKRTCINIDKVSSLNKSSKSANTREDFTDLNCSDNNKIDRNFTLFQFYQNIVKILRQTIGVGNRQLIFSILLYLNEIEKHTNNWVSDWINLSAEQAIHSNELNIKEARFEAQTLPDKRYFTSNDQFWLLAESADFTCLFSRKNNDGTIQRTGKFSIPKEFLSKVTFIVSNMSIAKLLLEIKKDCLNNLNIISKIDNKSFYSKINF